MGSFSNYAENKILDHILKTAVFTQPTNIYIALSTADPTENGSGIVEPVGGNYARALCNVWDSAASRATQNTAQITFNQASAGWGTITHFAVFDAATGGNMLAHGALTTPKTIASGKTPKINAGSFDVNFVTGGISTYLANAILNHVFKVAAYTPPTNIYAGLSTANPGDTGGSIAEPSGNAYARAVHNVWDAAASGASENTGEIAFADPTGAWGTLTHQFLSDALTSGNMLIYSALTQSESPESGDSVVYNDGAFDITLD
jgi:hypothetical protein